MEALMIGTAVRRIALAGIAIAAMSCAQPSTVDDGSIAPATHDRSVLSFEELHAMGDQYLYDDCTAASARVASRPRGNVDREWRRERTGSSARVCRRRSTRWAGGAHAVRDRVRHFSQVLHAGRGAGTVRPRQCERRHSGRLDASATVALSRGGVDIRRVFVTYSNVEATAR